MPSQTAANFIPLRSSPLHQRRHPVPQHDIHHPRREQNHHAARDRDAMRALRPQVYEQACEERRERRHERDRRDVVFARAVARLQIHRARRPGSRARPLALARGGGIPSAVGLGGVTAGWKAGRRRRRGGCVAVARVGADGHACYDGLQRRLARAKRVRVYDRLA